MRVELYIRGELFHTWEFDLLEFYDPLCELNHNERVEMWARILETCKREVEFAIMNKPYEFYFILPARKQPADINPEDQEIFLQQIIEHKSSSI